MDNKKQVERAGMSLFAAAFLSGVLLSQQFTELPEELSPGIPAFITFCLVSFCIAIYGYSSRKRPVITLSILFIHLFLMGLFYSFSHAYEQLSYRLPEEAMGKNVEVVGRVSGIPVAHGEVQRFEFEVREFHFSEQKDRSQKAVEQATTAHANTPLKIRLNWYYGEAVSAGEEWRLLVRLKPPHGFMNPGGFDYEGWLFQHGIHATGYVRKSPLNKLLQMADRLSIDHIRQRLSLSVSTAGDRDSASIEGEDPGMLALIRALSVGDRGGMLPAHWDVLAATGTSHLMAISGLHIGLASLFAYLAVRRVVPVVVMKRVPAQYIATVCGLIVASTYAAIAGFSIPTQRAVIMLLTISILTLHKRNGRPFDALGFALLLILLIDPSAVLSVGFWFSFAAVAVIFISLSSAVKVQSENESVLQRSYAIGVRWFRLQLILSLFLLPLSLFMFQQVSLVAPLANIVLIPYVSFLVVPVVFIGILCVAVALPLAQFFFTLAADLLEIIWPMLVFLADLPFSRLVYGGMTFGGFLLATVAIVLLLFPSAFVCLLDRFTGSGHRAGSQVRRLRTTRVFSAIFLVAQISDLRIIESRTVLENSEFDLTVLDVGQGASAVIRTSNHIMVFDAGARFSDRMDIGSAVVIPYLRSVSVSHIDALVISHGDADHIGGAQSLLDMMSVDQLIGQDIDALDTDPDSTRSQPCDESLHWSWDGVSFVFLSPVAGAEISEHEKRNHRSCVLRVSSVSGSVLLTGDIEKKTERRLVQKYHEKLSSDVLMVPHHGSNTSSSRSFISSVDPELSVISAGYNNRYKLPSARVLGRYRDDNRVFLLTADTGALTISLRRDRALRVERYRQSAGRYWNHRKGG